MEKGWRTPLNPPTTITNKNEKQAHPKVMNVPISVPIKNMGVKRQMPREEEHPKPILHKSTEQTWDRFDRFLTDLV